MPFRLSACLPQCLRSEDLSDSDHPVAEHESVVPRASFAESRRAGAQAAAGAALNAPALSATEWLTEVDFLTFAMNDFPKTWLMLAVLEDGRRLQNEELRGGVANADQMKRLREWQGHVLSLKRHWEEMATVSQRKSEELERLMILQHDPRLKSLLREQWLHADQQVKVSRQWFGTGVHDRAKSANQQAALHVDIAHYLLPYWERATPPQQVHLEQMFERCRQQGSYGEVRAFLASAQLPGWQHRVQHWCWRASPDSHPWVPDAAGQERCSALRQFEHKEAALKELKRLRTAADRLPQAQGLQAALKHACVTMAQALTGGPPRLNVVNRAWIELQGARVAKAHEASESVADAERRLVEIKAAMDQLPDSQHYRLAQAERHCEAMAGAYQQEDYDAVERLQRRHVALCRATLTLAQQPGADIERWVSIGEQRSLLKMRLDRWTDKPVKAGRDLLSASRAKELMDTLDVSPDPHTCEQCLAELQLIWLSLSRAGFSGEPGWPPHAPPPIPLFPPPATAAAPIVTVAAVSHMPQPLPPIHLPMRPPSLPGDAR
ncbi:hypothetical protein [Roseateles terrae]|uniref:DUF349 domain-containing protein n=1 Tax=Roseateles terrae TaxID=431060 RepID=A0ABR6GKZ3_9BURK|nr:hypothetical protein [Roseateles terrae]MBB3192730.1 hypothetical protein [Roseateles terrae]